MSEWSELVSGLVGGGLVMAVQATWRKFADRRDRGKVFSWLQSEFQKADTFKHRTTAAISKALNLTPERVYFLCHTDLRISPALGDREGLWNLSGEDQARRKGLWG